VAVSGSALADGAGAGDLGRGVAAAVACVVGSIEGGFGFAA
jgi:hypothetical protein